MIPIRFDIDIDDRRLLMLSRGEMPNTQEAVRKGTLAVWHQYVMNLSNPTGTALSFNGKDFVIHMVTGTYAGGIVADYPFNGDPLSGLVEPRGVAYAGALEAGYDAFDMKPKLFASPKAKTSKAGYRYIIIPMRRFRRSAYGLDPDPNETNPNYSNWNRDTLVEVLAKGQISDEKKQWTARTVRRTSKKKHHSQWTQFIALSERTRPVGSPGWWHPGLKPHPVAHATALQMAKPIKASILAAMHQDLREHPLLGRRAR